MNQDELIDSVYKKLNKSMGKRQPIYRLDDILSPTNIKEFVSTGCAPLDIALSNRKNGGFAIGRASEIRGNQSSGKSLLLATTLANAQKKGYYTALFDNEYAVDRNFYEAIGLDITKLVYGNIEYVEDVLQAIEEMIFAIREKDNDTPLVIGVDSIAGLKAKNELETDYEKGGYNTHKAIILSQKLPKIIPLLANHNVALIFTQQLRSNVGGMGFGPQQVSASGGKAVGYFISQRVDLSAIGSIKADNLIVGRRTRAKVTKNRMGPPFREAEFEIYFDAGIDDLKSCLDILVHYKIIKGKAWKTFAEPLDIPGIEPEYFDIEDPKKFQMKKWREWLSNKEIYDYMVSKIAELNIMKYTGHMDDDNTELELDNPDEEPEKIDID